MQSASPSKNNVLEPSVIHRKLRRMALQIAEQNADENTIIIAGISGNGEVVAKSIIRELKKVSSLQTVYTTIHLNKKDPQEVELQPVPDWKDKVVVVVDDVANTGKTMLFALKPFLDNAPKKIQTLVLVERSHKLFPIQTDYAGLSIATTLQEHIAVETEGEEIVGAYLH